jgi:hypothetical protein
VLVVSSANDITAAWIARRNAETPIIEGSSAKLKASVEAKEVLGV